MPDVKISALPASTTPLAGTEVLPIVQSATTRQVSVANLTAGRAVSALSIATTTGATFATTSGSVGIGTSSPATFSVGGAPVLVVGNNAQTQITLYGGSNVGDINFATSNSGVGLYSGVVRYDGTSNFMSFWTSSTEKMRIDTSGNVGIGLSSIATGIAQRTLQIDAGSGGMILLGGANTQSPNPRIFGGSTYDLNLAAGVTTGKMIFYTNDVNRLEIAANGIITMSAYGAGTATFSGSGVISSVSDETWKTKDGVPTNPNIMLQKLEPGYWFYNEEKAPTFGADRQLGFYAQNVHEAIGAEAAPTPEEGKPWGYYDRSVLAITVMSLKNALNTIEELKQRITALENK